MYHIFHSVHAFCILIDDVWLSPVCFCALASPLNCFPCTTNLQRLANTGKSRGTTVYQGVCTTCTIFFIVSVCSIRTNIIPASTWNSSSDCRLRSIRIGLRFRYTWWRFPPGAVRWTGSSHSICMTVLPMLRTCPRSRSETSSFSSGSQRVGRNRRRNRALSPFRTR